MFHWFEWFYDRRLLALRTAPLLYLNHGAYDISVVNAVITTSDTELIGIRNYWMV